MKMSGLANMYDIDPFSYSSTNQGLQYGAIGFDALGRMYRWVKVGASDLVKGNLIQSPARDTQFTDMAVASAVAAGANLLTLTNGTTTVTANQFDMGVAVVSVTPGLGQTFTIASTNTPTSGGAFNVTIFETVLTALTTSSKVTVRANHYNGVIQSPTTRTGKVVGVALAAIPTTYFGWIGVRGQFGVLSDANTATIGQSLIPSTTTAGTVAVATAATDNIIGVADVATVSAKVEPAYIDIS